MSQIDPALTAHTPASAGRLAWVDTARAACVIAVVAYHIYLWHFATIGMPVGSLAGVVWEQINRILGALRMPLLLILSGALASSRVSRGFSNGKALQSTVSNYYLYVLWLAIYAVAGWLLGSSSPGGDIDGDIPVVLQLVVPNTTLWFIYALAVYVPALILVRGAPNLLVLGGLGVLSVGSALLVSGVEPLWLKVVRLAVYFAAGVYGKELIFHFATARKYTLAGAGAVAAVALTLLAFASIPDALNELLYLFRSLAFAAALIGITAVIVRFRWVAVAGKWVGGKTLPIYVIHPLLIIGLSILAAGPLHGVFSAVAATPGLALVYPVVSTALIVGLCISIERVLVICRMQALFQVPGWLVVGRRKDVEPETVGD